MSPHPHRSTGSPFVLALALLGAGFGPRAEGQAPARSPELPPAAPAAGPPDAATAARRALEEARAQAGRLEAQIDKRHPERRVPLADWMYSKGLRSEALHQLDFVLAADPDEKHALELVKRWAGHVRIEGIPGGPAASKAAKSADTPQLAQQLRSAAHLPAATREIALARIAGGNAREQVRAAALAALKSYERDVRACAALVLRRQYTGEELQPLLDRAVLDGHKDVRAEAARALRDARAPAVILPCVKALGSKNAGVRANAAEALGNMGYPEAVGPLMAHLAAPAAAASGSANPGPTGSIFVGRQLAYIRDYDVEIAQGSSIADPVVDVIGEGAVLDVRVLGISTAPGVQVELLAISQSLAKLTGANPGKQAADWLAWWEQNRAEWQERVMRAATQAYPEKPATAGS